MKSWHPGEVVPDSGIYECDCGGGHHRSTYVRGHRFSPLPSGCSGAARSPRSFREASSWTASRDLWGCLSPEVSQAAQLPWT